jgi:ferrochelatase
MCYLNNTRKNKRSFLLLSLLFICLTVSPVFAEKPKIGVVFTCFGDIGSLDEVEGYTKNCFLDPDIVAMPNFLRKPLSNFIWWMIKESRLAAYEYLGGNTHYREQSRAQTDLIVEELRKKGYDVKGYLGFVLTYPYMRDTLAEIQKDGIEKLVIINQGALYSYATTEIPLRETRLYLKEHPEWKAEIIGVKSFIRDTRFMDLIENNIKDRLNTTFENIPNKNICILLPFHGVPMSMVEKGDPTLKDTEFILKEFKKRFKDINVYPAYQNHDYLFTGEWTKPAEDVVTKEIGKASYSHVLINGRITFTIDNIETLLTQGSSMRLRILDYDKNKKIHVEEMFNLEKPFVNYMATITEEALQGKGDIVILQHKNK